MLAFLLPVRHPANSKNYETIEAMLRETLDSLANTRDAEFCVFVACNKPLEDYDHPAVEFIDTGFAPPGRGIANLQSFQDFWKDKSTKIAAALLRAREVGAEQFMVVDADDFVHRDLARFCWEHRDEGSFYVEEGLAWRHDSILVADRPRFHHYCGTSHIVSMRAAESFIPKGLAPGVSQDQIIEAFPKAFREEVLGNHQKVGKVLATVGEKMLPVPFAAAVWRNGSAESHSGARFQQPPRLASRADVEAFGLPLGERTLGQMAGAAALTPWLWLRHMAWSMKKRAGMVQEYATRSDNQ